MRDFKTAMATIAVMPFMLGHALADTWHINFNSGGHSPTELIADIDRDGDALNFRSPGFNLDFSCDGDSCIATTGGGNTVTLNMDADSISGNVNAGALAGDLTGAATELSIDASVREYASIAEEIIGLLQENAFSRASTETPAFIAFTTGFRQRATRAHNDIEFAHAMREEWTDADPFSHVDFMKALMPVEGMLDYLDGMRLGYEVARLEWQGDIAVLTVDSMMGNDTIEQIEAAYGVIAERGARGLIIDLRENGGGAFAVKPLVEHVIDTPIDAGYFISRQWTENNNDLPDASVVAAQTPWPGWSVRTFWADVLERGVMRIRMNPDTNNYDGPVIVLTSNTTASAAEMAADAFKASGAAVIVGEQTEGAMLSQTMFDVSGGYHLSLPIADYYSATHGRIEGVGVTPDVIVPADEAMDVALQMLAQ